VPFVDAALAMIGATVLTLATVAGYIKNRLWISEPLICLVIGIILGPHVAGLVEFKPGQDLSYLQPAARITLAIAVMGAALRVPPSFLRSHARELLIILLLGMPAMWLISSVVAYFTLPASVLTALLVGAALTPTDPVLSTAIVTGQTAEGMEPAYMRNYLTVESGANDGLGLAFIMLPILLMQMPWGDALHEWLLQTLLWEICASIVIGLLAGWLAGRCLVWATDQPFSEPVSILTISLGLTLTVLATVHAIGSDGILAVFAAGVVFKGFVDRVENTDQERIQEAIGRFFDLPVFLLFGTVLPWTEWLNLGWEAVAFILGILLLRRLPLWIVAGRILRPVQSIRDSLLLGWFGPIGIAAIYYACLANHEVGDGLIWPAASLAVAASVLVHGSTATPIAHLYNPNTRRFGWRPVRQEEPPTSSP